MCGGKISYRLHRIKNVNCWLAAPILIIVLIQDFNSVVLSNPNRVVINLKNPSFRWDTIIKVKGV